MRAWTISARGLPTEVLKWSTSVPTPRPTPTQILVRISHAALNPGGQAHMALYPFFLRARDSTPEIDFAGTVVQAGAAAPWPVGARVFGAVGMKSMNAGIGTLADYIAIDAEQGGVAVLPDGVSFEQGAGLTACGNTALTMCRQAGMKEGDRVLVNGASGGVGTMLVQVAKALGAKEVVAVCSGRNIEMVKGLGADEVIDYQANHPVDAYLAKRYADQPFDHILDTVGVQALYLRSPQYLKTDEVYVNIGGYDGGLMGMLLNAMRNFLLPRWLGGTPRKYAMISSAATNDSVGIIAKLAAEGKVKTMIDQVFDIENALEAYKLLASQRARGKIVIKIQDSEGAKSL